MQKQIKIRKICKIDIAKLKQIEKECFPFLCPENFEFVIDNNNYLYIAITKEDDIIGYAGVSIVYDECDLNFICIKREFRKKGYSKLLLDYLINALKERGVKKIFLEVSEDNFVAINLYISYGFTLISKRKNYYQDKTALVMVKQL